MRYASVTFAHVEDATDLTILDVAELEPAILDILRLQPGGVVQVLLIRVSHEHTIEPAVLHLDDGEGVRRIRDHLLDGPGASSLEGRVVSLSL